MQAKHAKAMVTVERTISFERTSLAIPVIIAKQPSGKTTSDRHGTKAAIMHAQTAEETPATAIGDTSLLAFLSGPNAMSVTFMRWALMFFHSSSVANAFRGSIPTTCFPNRKTQV